MVINLIEIVIIILIGFFLPLLFYRERERRHLNILRKLLLFHFFAGIAFYFLTNNGGGDAWTYWTEAKKMQFEDFSYNLLEAKGTYFLYAFNYIPANFLKMNFFTNTMFYALIGYLGIIFFYQIAIKTVPNNYRLKGYLLFPLILFMPNMHLWSSGVGKDTLSFLCVGMFGFGMLEITKRIPLIILSLVLSYLVRPHIVLFLLIGFTFAFIFDRKIKTVKKIGLSLVLVIISIFILPNVLEFAKIDDASLSSISTRGRAQAELLSGAGTGSSVDISSYPLPLKVFTFLYRPLFFDINGIPALLVSVENLLLLILSIIVFFNKPVATFKAAPFVIKGLVIFLIIGSVAFSISLGNMGIMIRMRNMLLPGLLIFIMWSFSYQVQQRRSQRKKFASIKTKAALNFIK